MKDEIQPIERRVLKKWSGLTKTADPSIFFRSHEHFGLNIPELCVVHKKQRLIRRHQLANNADARVRAIHEEFTRHEKHRQKRGTNEWKETCQMESLLAEVRMNKIKER